MISTVAQLQSREAHPPEVLRMPRLGAVIGSFNDRCMADVVAVVAYRVSM
jgi:hypothetical protein